MRHTLVTSALAAVLFVAPSGAWGQVDFGSMRAWSTGSQSSAIAAGDFDEDGHLDFAVACTFSWTNPASCGGAAVFLSDGADSYLPGPFLCVDTSRSARSIACADFNRDGHLDLAIVAGDVVVFLGDGHGGFRRSTSLGLRFMAVVAAGDLNGDGVVDLVVTDGSQSIYVYLGDGTGQFSQASAMTNFFYPTGIAIADFDEDGNADVAVARLAPQGSGGHYGLALLRGDGTGHFAPMELLLPSGNIAGCIATDFDADGHIDLIVVDQLIGDIAILRGHGASGFSIERFILGVGAKGIVAGDFDEDGQLDLVVYQAASQSGPLGQVFFLPGDGLGGIRSVNVTLPGGNPTALVAADVDRDGHLDLASLDSDDFSILRGDGHGGFFLPPSFPAGGDASVIRADDLNGDGRPDIVTANSGDGTVSVLSNQSPNGLGAPSVYRAGRNPRSLYAPDFNWDGRPDLAMLTSGQSSSDLLSILLGDGTGAFAPVLDFTLDLPSCKTLLATDLDEDGHPDFVVTSATPGTMSGIIASFLTDGSTIRRAWTFDSPPYGIPNLLATEDVNGDGHADLIVTSLVGPTGSGTRTFAGDGAGAFTDINVLAGYGRDTVSIRLRDADEDGRLDLIAADSTGTVRVWIGNGWGGFGSFKSVSVGGGCLGARLVDLDGDGHRDLLAVKQGNAVAVLLGDGHGNLGPAQEFATGRSPLDALAVNLDGDGLFHLVVANRGTRDVSILRNAGRATQEFRCIEGNVNARAGAPANVLFVNGSPGSGAARMVFVAPTDAVDCRMDAPPSRAVGPSPFALYAWPYAPSSSTIRSLPLGLGQSCLPMPLSGGRPLRIANNIGFEDRLGSENWPGPPTQPAPSVVLRLPHGIGQAATLFLQGLIADSAAPNRRAAVTNGILVIAR